MLWIAVVIVVCEVVVFAQLMLSYQKRSARLRVARAPILKRIQDHRQTLSELTETVQQRTADALSQIEDRVADFRYRTGHAANLVADLDSEAHERAEELGLHEEEEEEGEGEEAEERTPADGEDFNPMKVVKDKSFDPFDAVRSIRTDLEDIHEHLESVQHDEEIVTNMAQRLAAAGNGTARGD